MIFFNPMIVFVCGNHQENKNGNTFLLRKSGNTCINIGISDLHLVKLPPIYIFQCNVRQSALQKFLKISIKNSKCATSNKHIQDGRPGRYKNRRGSKKKARHAQKDPTHHPGTRMSEMSSPRRRENQEFGHLTAKGQGFGRKVPNETIVPRR